MLSKLQTTLHWHRWTAVAAANDWHTDAGRLAPGAQATRGLSIFHKLVWREAEAAARQEVRAVSADDLRHGCYRVATTKVPGWPAAARVAESMHDLGNREFSRVLTLWGDGHEKSGLLIEAECLTSLMAWDDPDLDAAKWLDRRLEKSAPDATLRAIASNAFGTKLWEQLTAPDKRWLLGAVMAKAQKFNPGQAT